VHNEKHTLPLWVRYYERHFNRKDIWILDHNTDDGSTSAGVIPAPINVIKLQGNSLWMPHTFLNRAVEAHMQRMFSGGYRCALLAEVDDMVIADPNVYPGGLAELLRAFAASSAQYHRTVGYELAHVSEGVDPEPAMNWSKPILQQRTFWGRHVLFDKPYLTKVPINYTHGFHSTSSPPPEAIEALPSMRLVHLHHADRSYCDAREAAKHGEFLKLGMVPQELRQGSGKRVGKSYAAHLKAGGICTWAHARRKDARVLDARGHPIERIEERWRLVEV